MSRYGHALSRNPALDPFLPDDSPSQNFFRTLRHRTVRRGEMRLALAVLEDAVRRIERRGRSGGLLRGADRREAETWMLRRNRGTIFAFENVCTILDIDADEVRRLFLGRPGRLRHGGSRPSSPIPGCRVPRHPLILPSMWA
jgi:hypothetical protein